MAQVEVSRTLVFTQPRYARGFFEALVADNLDLGRPDTIQIVFDRQIRGGRACHRRRVQDQDHHPRHRGHRQRLLQDLPQSSSTSKMAVPCGSRPLPNAPNDLGCQRRLHNLDELQTKGRAVNARLLQAERVGQGCVLANPVFERIAHPTVTAEGRRATALRFGDSRVQALAGALCVTLCAVTGITNRSLRALMTGLLGVPYGMNQASYDLARLRRKGLITVARTPTPTTSPPTDCGSPCSTPRCTPASSPRSSPPTNPRPHPNSAPHSTPSTDTSTEDSPQPGCPSSPNTRLNCRTPSDKGSLAT